MPMARNAEWQGLAHAYQRHQPEHTRHYYIVEHHYPKFVAHLVEQGRSLLHTSSRSLKTISNAVG